jgi:hypothetical protein
MFLKSGGCDECNAAVTRHALNARYLWLHEAGIRATCNGAAHQKQPSATVDCDRGNQDNLNNCQEGIAGACQIAFASKLAPI